MDIILTLIYISVATVCFKVFKVPVNKWSVTTTALVGGFLMGWMYISMAFFHPFTPYGQAYFLTTPLGIRVKGIVTELYVTDDRPLKKGEPIFAIDPAPYQSKVDTLEAELQLAKIRLGQSQELFDKKAGNKFDLQERKATVAQLEGELLGARSDLEATVVRAPENGHLVQNKIKLGTLAANFKISSLVTFVPDGSIYYIGSFRQNGLPNIEEGFKAEVYFTAVPGRTFKARVKKVWGELAEGQLIPFSTMRSANRIFHIGRVPVQIEFLEDISGYNIPSGAFFGVTVYSEHLEPLAELRKILLHMYSWKNIINFEVL